MIERCEFCGREGIPLTVVRYYIMPELGEHGICERCREYLEDRNEGVLEAV